MKMENVMDRVKTFEDAVNELGENHEFVQAYNAWKKCGFNDQKDIEAYMKLRIITTALNEISTLYCNENIKHYAPFFQVYTEEELNILTTSKRAETIPTKYGYFAYRAWDIIPECTLTPDALLYFESPELAEYAGKQFTELYCYLSYCPKGLY